MKKNLSMSTGFLKPFTVFFKKYIALFPSIAITVVAVLLFIPTMLVGDSVKEKMKKSVSLANNVASMARDVPSEDAPEQIERYMNRLEETARRVETLAIQSSMRELISYDVFPPRGTSSELYMRFGREYRSAIENMLKEMNALDAPSEAEIRSQTKGSDSSTKSTRDRRVTKVVIDVLDPMVDAFCQQRADAISVYANPSAFAWYEFWDEYEFQDQDQALEDCWDSQVAFWIYEDIVKTIEKMNQGSTAVSSSPVKRLLGISFSGPVILELDRSTVSRSNRARGASKVSDRDKPNYIIGSEKGEISASTAGTSLDSLFLSASLSGRSGNEDVDVIHFGFSVLVENHYVLAFMKELCSEKLHHYHEGFKKDGELKEARHNQITLLKSDISAIDKLSPEHELYRYGNKAVIRLDLVCEYQFVRKGYDLIKPDPIKELLGQSVTETQSGMPGGGML